MNLSTEKGQDFTRPFFHHLAVPRVKIYMRGYEAGQQALLLHDPSHPHRHLVRWWIGCWVCSFRGFNPTHGSHPRFAAPFHPWILSFIFFTPHGLIELKCCCSRQWLVKKIPALSCRHAPPLAPLHLLDRYPYANFIMLITSLRNFC